MTFYLDPPFNMLISGMTNCGKTHFVLSLLQEEFKNRFDHIIIICPTFEYNKTYNRKFISNDPDIIPIIINDKLNEVLEKIIGVYKDNKEQTLVLIDDCANLNDAKIKATALTKLAFHGRHFNISTWVLAQKYNSIIKDFRQNIAMLVLFYDKDKDSRESAFKENDIGLTGEEKADIIEALKEKKTKVIFRLVQPFKFCVI
jgi:GTPase SAR1 family protein